MNLRIWRPAMWLAVALLAATAAAGCCEEESTAPDPVPAPKAAAPTEAPKTPAPAAKPAETPKAADKAAEPKAEAPPSAPGVNDDMAPGTPPPEGVIDGVENVGDPALEGKSPEEIAAYYKAEQEKRGGLAKALGVETGPDGYQVDYADAGGAQLAVALKEDSGTADFKAALVKDGVATGETTDLATFTGADAALLAKFKKCDNWGQNTRDTIDMGDKGKALQVSFWCHNKDGTAAELVSIKSLPADAKTLADFKTLWVGEGGVATKPEGQCQIVTEAKFAYADGQLIRTRKATAAFLAPPAKDDPEGGGEPVVVDAAAEEPAELQCKVPEEPTVDKFPL